MRALWPTFSKWIEILPRAGVLVLRGRRHGCGCVGPRYLRVATTRRECPPGYEAQRVPARRSPEAVPVSDSAAHSRRLHPRSRGLVLNSRRVLSRDLRLSRRLLRHPHRRSRRILYPALELEGRAVPPRVPHPVARRLGVQDGRAASQPIPSLRGGARWVPLHLRTFGPLLDYCARAMCGVFYPKACSSCTSQRGTHVTVQPS